MKSCIPVNNNILSTIFYFLTKRGVENYNLNLLDKTVANSKIISQVKGSDADPDLWIRICIIKVGSV